MLYEIKCLTESVNLITEISFDIVSVTNYKYHSTVIMATYHSFPTFALLKLNIPIIFSSELTEATTLNLYNKDSVLTARAVISKLKPKLVNWKLQHQRHQVVKLLNITS